MKNSDPKEAARAAMIEKVVAAMAENNSVLIVQKTYQATTEPFKIPANFFVESVDDVEYISEVREALRSWFCCFLPVNDQVHGPGLERSIKLYQDLDEFLSNLIVAAAQ